MPNLFVKANIVLHSGQTTDWKIECDALTDEDVKTLCYLISVKVTFGCVYGVPNGGSRFEKELLQYATRSARDPILIVDDVLTTGESMETAREQFSNLGYTIGVVIFSRGKCPDWITPIFQLMI